MPKQRSLADLFVRGTELTLDDGDGAVTVWLQKPNPVEYAAVLRSADSAKARTLSQRNYPDSDAYLTVHGEVDELTRDEMVQVLIDEEHMRIDPIVKEELALAADSEWSKDNYLQGLYDALATGLKDRLVTEPDDPEVKRVRDELSRYFEAVTKEIDGRLEDFRALVTHKPLQELKEDLLRLGWQMQGRNSWLVEYQRAEIWQALRDNEDHSKKVFATRDEVDILQDETVRAIAVKLRALTVDPIEGKDSAVSPPSSD